MVAALIDLFFSFGETLKVFYHKAFGFIPRLKTNISVGIGYRIFGRFVSLKAAYLFNFCDPGSGYNCVIIFYPRNVRYFHNHTADCKIDHPEF